MGDDLGMPPCGANESPAPEPHDGATLASLRRRVATLEAELATRLDAERLLTGQARVLEMIAARAPLADTLATLIGVVESQANGLIGSILVRDPVEERFHLGVAPSLAPSYIGVLANAPITPPYPGPCGQAAFRGEFVSAPDIATDDRWAADWRQAALDQGLRACFSSPIVASDGAFLGSFGNYFREPRDEHTLDRQIVGAATHLAGTAIERSRAEAERMRLLAEAEKARVEAETLHRVGQVLVAELEQEKLLQAITDAATTLSGAEHGAFFYNVRDEHGEAYRLYALSGAPREQFADLPMPRNTELFHTTYAGGGIIRLADVTQDPRFGTNAPYYGLPAGHIPLTSYLAVPVVARDGEVLGGLFFGHRRPGVFTERSERMVSGMAATAAIAIENARLYQQIQQAVHFRDDFLAAVAHDLKTPLTSIKGRAQLLRRQVAKVAPAGAERLERGLASIDATAGLMQGQLDELLDLTHTVIGQERELQREPTDLVALAHQVTEVQLFSKRHRIRIETALPALIGEWDTQRLARVIGNLLSNAIKYSPPGSEIVVSVAQAANGWAVLSVRDQGMGVPADDRGRIFERFQRAQNVPGQTAGTGIGLASAKQVVEQHGGTIGLESEEGVGSIFTVRLPLTSEREDQA